MTGVHSASFYDGQVSAGGGLRPERRRSPNCELGRGGRRPEAIVVHTTDGSFDAAAAWFEDPESGVSAHYLVGLDGRLAQFVSEEDTARHAGRLLHPTARIAALRSVSGRAGRTTL